MDDQTHQQQAHGDQQRATEDRDRGQDQAHSDADKLLAATKAANPFSLTNVLITIAILFGGWMGEQVWSGVQDHQKQVQEGINDIRGNIAGIHDSVLTHTIDIGNIKVDVAELKATRLTEQQVDDRVRRAVLSQEHGSERLTIGKPTGSTQANFPPTVGELQPRDGFGYYQ